LSGHTWGRAYLDELGVGGEVGMSGEFLQGLQGLGFGAGYVVGRVGHQRSEIAGGGRPSGPSCHRSAGTDGSITGVACRTSTKRMPLMTPHQGEGLCSDEDVTADAYEEPLGSHRGRLCREV
jgi:hypothetical protein